MNDKSGPAIAGTIVLNLRSPVGKPVPVSVHIAGDIKTIHDTAGGLFGSGIDRRTGRMLSQGPGFRGGNTGGLAIGIKRRCHCDNTCSRSYIKINESRGVGDTNRVGECPEQFKVHK